MLLNQFEKMLLFVRSEDWLVPLQTSIAVGLDEIIRQQCLKVEPIIIAKEKKRAKLLCLALSILPHKSRGATALSFDFHASWPFQLPHKFRGATAGLADKTSVFILQLPHKSRGATANPLKCVSNHLLQLPHKSRGATAWHIIKPHIDSLQLPHKSRGATADFL